MVETKDFRLALSDYATVFTNDGKLLLGWSKSADATEIVITDERGRRVCTATLLATLLDALPAPRRAAPTHE